MSTEGDFPKKIGPENLKPFYPWRDGYTLKKRKPNYNFTFKFKFIKHEILSDDQLRKLENKIGFVIIFTSR